MCQVLWSDKRKFSKRMKSKDNVDNTLCFLENEDNPSEKPIEQFDTMEKIHGVLNVIHLHSKG